MKKRKDILFLCQYFYPEYISSATLPYDTAVALKEAGFSVEVLCGYPNEYNKKEDISIKEVTKGIKINRVRYLQLGRFRKLGRLINYFSFTLRVLLKFAYLRKFKSIIVYSNPPILPYIASIASKFYKSKLIFVSYDVYPEIAEKTGSILKSSIIYSVMHNINRVIFKNVHKIVALSDEMKRYLLTNREGIKDDSVEIIPNWYEDKGSSIDTSLVNDNIFKDINEENDFIVSYFGNMGTCQDMDTIIEAVKYLNNKSNIKFIFAGHGNKVGLIRETVLENKLGNVLIYDFLHGDDYKYALHISDCFLVSLYEGLTGLAVPSKTYSYMMNGKPIIAIMDEECDIAYDLIQNNAGFVIKNGDSKQLVSSILELQNDKQHRLIMGKNCKEVFKKNYTKILCTKKYVDLFKEVLGE